MAWIRTTERQPTIPGEYRIKNNMPSCNNGEGTCEWSGDEWYISEMIKGFFKVLYWWE